MRSTYKILDDNSPHFMTSTIIEWIPVFTSEKYFNILTDAIKYSQVEKGFIVNAYVILDNHFHIVASAKDLSGVMQSIKSFSAKRIIKECKSDRKTWLLNQLKYYRKKYKIGRTHQIWQEGFHPIKISGIEMMNQKVEYIHYNPVKRGLVNKPEDWRYSSAIDYLTVEKGLIDIVKLR